MSKNYILLPNGDFVKYDELRHASVRKGEEREDHKYISREWKNGRWNYTYPSDTKSTKLTSKTESTASTSKPKNSFLSNLRKWAEDKSGITARKEAETAKAKTKSTENAAKVANKMYNEYRDKAVKDNYITKSEQTDIDVAQKRKTKADEKNTKAGEEYLAKQEAYLKTPVGMIENVSNKVSEFFAERTKSVAARLEEDRQRREEEEKIEREAKEETDRQKKIEKAKKATEERDSLMERMHKEFANALTSLAKNNPFPQLKLKTQATTHDEDMAAVNPNYTTDKENYDENCAYCSLTYEFRRRGYDVEAMPEYDHKGLTAREVAKLYKTDGHDFTTEELVELHKQGYSVIETLEMEKASYGIVTKEAFYKEHKDEIGRYTSVTQLQPYVEQELLSYGEGARGEFGVYWRTGGGHSITWEVENGSVVFRDNQRNKVIDIRDYLSHSNDFDFFRTDNLEFSDEALKYVRNREE